MPIHEIRHPLIRHKLGLMRRGDLSTKNFREMAQEVAALLTYEASKDLPLEPEVVQGWCGDVTVERLAGKKVTVEIGRATSELQSLMRISYAVFCLKKKKKTNHNKKSHHRETR